VLKKGCCLLLKHIKYWLVAFQIKYKIVYSVMFETNGSNSVYLHSKT